METENDVLIGELLDELGAPLRFEVLAGRNGLHRAVFEGTIQRPQLALTGFLDYFTPRNLNVFGKTEVAYLESLATEARLEHWTRYLEYHPPAIIIARNQTLPPDLLRVAEEAEICVLRTPEPTDELIRKLEIYLERKMAPSVTIHGVLVDVFGVGTLILGDSGVGKSETALELLQRGHRLVSDDIVEIRRIRADRLIGSSPDLTKHHMEIRGLGILNIRQLYGASAIVDETTVELVARLEAWEEGKEYDRLGLDEEFEELLGLKISRVMVPVQPGRNIAIIIEVGAMNHRLKDMGVYTAAEFSRRLDTMLRKDGSYGV